MEEIPGRSPGGGDPYDDPSMTNNPVDYVLYA